MHKMVVPYSSNMCENWKQSRPINVWIHRLPRENVSTMSPALVGRNFSSVDILLTFMLCQCNVMTLLNNLSGTGAWTKFVRRAPTRNVSMTSGRGRSSRRRFIPVGTTSATSPVESSSSLLLLRLSSLLTGLSLLLTLSSSCGGPTKGLPPPGTSTSRSVVALVTTPHRPGLSSTKCCWIPELGWKPTMKHLLLSEFHDLLVKPIGIWTHQMCPWKWCCPGSGSRRLVQQQMVQNNIPAYKLQVGRNSHRGCYGPHGGFGCYGDPLFEEWSSLILRCQRVDDGREHDIRYRSVDCCSVHTEESWPPCLSSWHPGQEWRHDLWHAVAGAEHSMPPSLVYHPEKDGPLKPWQVLLHEGSLTCRRLWKCGQHSWKCCTATGTP